MFLYLIFLLRFVILLTSLFYLFICPETSKVQCFAFENTLLIVGLQIQQRMREGKEGKAALMSNISITSLFKKQDSGI